MKYKQIDVSYLKNKFVRRTSEQKMTTKFYKIAKAQSENLNIGSLLNFHDIFWFL